MDLNKMMDAHTTFYWRLSFAFMHPVFLVEWIYSMWKIILIWYPNDDFPFPNTADPTALSFIISPWSLLLLPSGSVSFTDENVSNQDLRAFTAPEVLQNQSLSSLSDVEKVQYSINKFFQTWVTARMWSHTFILSIPGQVQPQGRLNWLFLEAGWRKEANWWRVPHNCCHLTHCL